MTIRKSEEIKKMVEHPLEEFFNIEPASTEIVQYERKTELKPYEQFDEKDTELEAAYQEIADAAMSGYDNLSVVAETADTKFLPRLGEVQVQHLNVALAAISKRAALKQGKDKLAAAIKAGPSKQTTNILVMDRNELLRQVLEDDSIIDGEAEDVTPDKE